ncbi:MAG: WD40-repeat-containing domain protein [Benniella sp.]|nr:MAG: WD40-repeat-containing domain protein [Benniella sp.]
MVFGSVVPSHLSALSLKQALELSNLYLENAYRTKDQDIVLVLCHEVEAALSQAKSASKKLHTQSGDAQYQAMRDGVATAYVDLNKLLERQGHPDVALAIMKKAVKWGGSLHHPGRLALTFQSNSTTDSKSEASGSAGVLSTVGPANAPSPNQRKQDRDIVTIDSRIFSLNVDPPTIDFKLPEPDERLNSTPQLVCCLGVLQASRLSDITLDPIAQKWLQVIENNNDEQERLQKLVTEVVRAYKRDELKDAKVITEVVYLAPVLSKDTYQDLLRELYSGIDHSGLLNVHQLEGIAQLIQGGDPGYLDADDLVKILGLLSTRLRDTHQQSTQHMYRLTLAVSHVLDAMADTNVADLDRETLHEPLSLYLKDLKSSSDPYLVYQAAYAYQALLCVPDNETTWQAAMRRTGKVIQGVSGLVSAVKGLDLIKFIEGLRDLQKGLAGVSQVAGAVKTAYDGVVSLVDSGNDFMDCLKEGFSFEHKRAWYSALRGADALIRDGELATFRELVCEVPFRRDPAFQWGVCQRLGEIAANPMWDADVRQSAILFLGEIYQNDEVWGQQPSVKQWIINILMQLISSSVNDTTIVAKLLQDLGTNGDAKKQALYRGCRENGTVSYPLKAALPELASPSLLDRVQNRPDVEGNLRLLKKLRTQERSNAVYIPPQAKPSIRSLDNSQFPLMEKVKEFLESDRKVFLLLGDSGAGKSTFSRELEYELWGSYKNKNDRIPLHINLPAIDKPEHDMIAKQLRRNEFSEPQIRELKYHRKFILICDGYDESQQTHNLYMSNGLNQPGGWDAQMVISCRSEYLGDDYGDRFQPGDRNKQSDSSMFQEAVISPFSIDQVHSYIHQYVLLRQPMWQASDYKQALELIPSLKDLVKNPFLMTLSLEVLPRMVDPGQQLSTARVTRVGLYDHFVEQWLERGKKRLGEKDMSPQFKTMFERLSAEGFTVNGIGFIKKLAVAIYKKQDGHPVVEYSQLLDGGSWKDFFFKDEHNQLLLEASPLTRNGNQHRFIHRSLLEYALSRAVFDPQDRKSRTASESVSSRRGSVSSTLSFEKNCEDEEEVANVVQGPDRSSPLVWRRFVHDHSLLQFLEERVQQELAFKEQLLSYIEYSKTDKKWRTAAANAITILVRAGVQFNGADLQGIQIPGADLSYGSFDSAQFQGADLRKVNLRGVWMRQADLSRVQMTGVQFGELPFLTQDDEVWSCAYSPDGKSFAVGLKNGDIGVYTTSGWEEPRTLSGHRGMVKRIVYSSHGDQMASCGEDETVRLWHVEAGECRHVLRGHTRKVNCVAYSPQGDRVASASDDTTVRIWDTLSGECLQTLSGHSSWVLCVAFSPQGDQIASGDGDHLLLLWDVETWKCSHILSGHSGRVSGVAYSPKGGQLATASWDKTIRLWDTRTGACRYSSTGHTGYVGSLAFSPNGDQLASAGQDETVRLWDVESGTCRQTLTGHTHVIQAVVYSPKGDQVASASQDRTLRLWDVSTAASLFVPSGHSSGVTSVSCSLNGDQIVSGSADQTARLWSMETGECYQSLRGHSDTVLGVAFSPQGNQIATASCDDTVRLWDMKTGAWQHTLIGHNDWVWSVAYSPDGQTVASASRDKTARLWDARTGTCHTTLHGHTQNVLSVVFSPDGEQIATCSMDSTIRLWVAENGACHQVLEGHGDCVARVVYSPQGNHLASASDDMTVRLWDVESGECRFILIGHSSDLWCVAYSMKGDLLASGGEDKTVRLWSTESGQCLAVLRNFQDTVRSVAWSTASDATYLVTGCMDGSVLKWEAAKVGEEYRTNLCWGATNGMLTVTDASIEDVRGLSQPNRQLLKQRGAIGEPERLLHEAGKKVATMASVVSTLRRLPGSKVQESFLTKQDKQNQTGPVGEQLQ